MRSLIQTYFTLQERVTQANLVKTLADTQLSVAELFDSGNEVFGKIVATMLAVAVYELTRAPTVLALDRENKVIDALSELSWPVELTAELKAPLANIVNLWKWAMKYLTTNQQILEERGL